MKLVKLRRPKATSSPSYVDYRSKTNVSILWDMGHIKGRLFEGGIRQGKKTKNLNAVDVLRNEYRMYKSCTGLSHHGKWTRAE
jgi:hypothetical protein